MTGSVWACDRAINIADDDFVCGLPNMQLRFNVDVNNSWNKAGDIFAAEGQHWLKTNVEDVLFVI